MNTFFNLIDTIPTPKEEFDVQRYNKIASSFGVGQYDDFIAHFAFFLYEFPLPKKLQSIFNEKDLDGKVGITSRHLIKTAKRLNVDQEFIDHYFHLKNNKNLYLGFFEYSGNDRNEEGYQIYSREFNRVTFKLIKSVLGSK